MMERVLERLLFSVCDAVFWILIIIASGVVVAKFLYFISSTEIPEPKNKEEEE